MEIWDVLDKDGNKTGKTIQRGGKLKHGEYHLVVHIWITNNKEEILIQKRPDHLEFAPGIWAIAGGSAIQGETSIEAACRETKEELGISIKPVLKPAMYLDECSVTDIWYINDDINIKEVKYDKREVSDVKWVTVHELKSMIRRGKFYKALDDYYELLFDAFDINLLD